MQYLIFYRIFGSVRKADNVLDPARGLFCDNIGNCSVHLLHDFCRNVIFYSGEESRQGSEGIHRGGRCRGFDFCRSRGRVLDFSRGGFSRSRFSRGGFFLRPCRRALLRLRRRRGPAVLPFADPGFHGFPDGGIFIAALLGEFSEFGYNFSAGLVEGPGLESGEFQKSVAVAGGRAVIPLAEIVTEDKLRSVADDTGLLAGNIAFNKDLFHKNLIFGIGALPQVAVLLCRPGYRMEG